MRTLTTAVVALAVLAPPAAAAGHLEQMVVFRSGAARISHPSLAPVSVKVGRRRCAVGGGTPLAALVRSAMGPFSLRDYGHCTNRPVDAGGLFVSAIGGQRNRGMDGWVYKVGNTLAPAGAADPSGPFGRGRLRAGAHVLWFWCHVTQRAGGCPHNLGVSVTAGQGGVTVHVRQFNDGGEGRPAGGAVVHVGRRTASTGRDGTARLRVRRGRYSVWAGQPGRIRSFPVSVAVR